MRFGRTLRLRPNWYRSAHGNESTPTILVFWLMRAIKCFFIAKMFHIYVVFTMLSLLLFFPWRYSSPPGVYHPLNGRYQPHCAVSTARGPVPAQALPVHPLTRARTVHAPLEMTDSMDSCWQALNMHARMHTDTHTHSTTATDSVSCTHKLLPRDIRPPAVFKQWSSSMWMDCQVPVASSVESVCPQ